jgi:hypothetical protein
LRDVELLITLVLVTVWDAIEVDGVVLLEAFELFSQNFFYPGDLKEAERVRSLPNAQQVETENEIELMLFVVPDKRHKSVLTFVHQIPILLHFCLNLILQLRP